MAILKWKWPRHPLLFWSYKQLRQLLEVHKPKSFVWLSGNQEGREQLCPWRKHRSSLLNFYYKPKHSGEVWDHEQDASFQDGFLWWGCHWRVSSPSSPQHQLALFSDSTSQTAWTAQEEHSRLPCDSVTYFTPRGFQRFGPWEKGKWTHVELKRQENWGARPGPGGRYLTWRRQGNIQYGYTHWLPKWIPWWVWGVTQPSA